MIVFIRWAIGVMLGILVSGGVSGGHINPAVTVAMASVGKFPWGKVRPQLVVESGLPFQVEAESRRVPRGTVGTDFIGKLNHSLRAPIPRQIHNSSIPLGDRSLPYFVE